MFSKSYLLSVVGVGYCSVLLENRLTLYGCYQGTVQFLVNLLVNPRYNNHHSHHTRRAYIPPPRLETFPSLVISLEF